jgi:DNA-binding transcriptional MerR regulator
MNMSTQPTSNTYRIGKVSSLTGVSPDTLRIWQRRYNAVIPGRSETGGRLYSSADITRLKLMKALVDAGDSISSIAGLSQEALEARAAESLGSLQSRDSDQPLRITIIGETLAAKVDNASEQLEQLELIGRYKTPQALLGDSDAPDIDILVIEQPTLQPSTAELVVDLMAHSHAAHVVVIYRFASHKSIAQLPLSRCSTLRAPVEPLTLEQHCISIAGMHVSADTIQGDPLHSPMPPAPARRYDDTTLTRIASISPTIQCECPHHLAELITSLNAFELYSSQCESRNDRDAELHGYLSNTTAHARHMIEKALGIVLEAENIEI